MGIPHVNGYNSFPQSGWPAQCLTKTINAPSNATVLAVPSTLGLSATTQYVLLGVMTVNEATLKNSTTDIMVAPSDGGGWALPGAVAWGADEPIIIDSQSDVTIFYYIEDLNLR